MNRCRVRSNKIGLYSSRIGGSTLSHSDEHGGRNAAGGGVGGLFRLTGAEREYAKFVCFGRSGQWGGPSAYFIHFIQLNNSCESIEVKDCRFLCRKAFPAQEKERIASLLRHLFFNVLARH